MTSTIPTGGRPRWVPALEQGWLAVRVVVTLLLLLEAASVAVVDLPTRGRLIEWASTASVILLCWFPSAGMAAAVVALSLCLVFRPWGSDPQVLLAIFILLLPRLSWRSIAVTWLLGLAYAVVVGIRFSDAPLQTTTVPRVAVLLVGSVIGLVARWFLQQHRLGQARIEDLEQQSRQVRADERAALARELHDVVAHQLSITSLQVMANRMSDDVGNLHQALDRIDESTRAALNELRLMVGVLRESDDTDDTDDTDNTGVDDLREVAQPTARADQLAFTLREAGFAPDMDIDPRVDTVDLSQQRTISRVLQEATTNILRNAPEGATCRYVVSMTPELVRVRVTNPMPRPGTPSRLTGHSMGYGLRGIRERVDLTGGVLVAHQEGADWVLQLDLPRPAAG